MFLYGTEWMELPPQRMEFSGRRGENRGELFVAFRVKKLKAKKIIAKWRKKYRGHMSESDVLCSAESKIHYIHLPPAEYKYDPGMGFISV
jgi:hypothetical protein